MTHAGTVHGSTPQCTQLTFQASLPQSDPRIHSTSKPRSRGCGQMGRRQGPECTWFWCQRGIGQDRCCSWKPRSLPHVPPAVWPGPSHSSPALGIPAGQAVAWISGSCLAGSHVLIPCCATTRPWCLWARSGVQDSSVTLSPPTAGRCSGPRGAAPPLALDSQT